MTNQQKLTKDVHLWQHGKTYVFMLSGKAGVGKTLAASILLDRLLNTSSFNFVEVASFAKQVKKIARESFGWDLKKDVKGRKLLQVIGNGGREYNPDIWASYVLDTYTGGFPRDAIIIDDWRYANEKDVLSDEKSFEIITIRIDDSAREMLRDTSAYSDISETSLDNYKFDYVIVDAEDANALKNELYEIVEKVLTK